MICVYFHNLQIFLQKTEQNMGNTYIVLETYLCPSVLFWY